MRQLEPELDRCLDFMPALQQRVKRNPAHITKGVQRYPAHLMGVANTTKEPMSSTVRSSPDGRTWIALGSMWHLLELIEDEFNWR